MGHHVKKKRRQSKVNGARLNDGVVSMQTSLGSKVNAISYSGKLVSDSELLRTYRDSWIVKKYIDKTADDMIKLGREISGEVSDEIKQRIKDVETELDVQKVFYDALSWASLLGDSLIVAITDIDESLISTELSLEKEGIVKFIVFRKGEYKPSRELNTDIKSPHFAKPEFFNISVGGTELKFHRSRCHRTKLGKHSLKDAAKPGTSDIQSAYSVIKTFDAAVTSVGDTIQDANVDVIFLPNLNRQISAGEEEKVVEYARVVKSTKSSTNMLLMDAGTNESPGRYEQKNAQFSGLSDVLVKLANVVAGSLDRTITLMFGQSASGFNSGEEDNTTYYETIGGLKETRLRPMQNFVDQFILDKLATNLETISYEYPSIDSINEAEEAERFSKYATAFLALVSESIVTGEFVLREMQALGFFRTLTAKDIALAKEMDGQYEQSQSEGNSGNQRGWA